MIRARRLIAGVLAAAAVLATAVAPAVAAATLTVSPQSGVPGQVLHAIGSGFSGDQQIKLQWDAGFLPETGSSDSSGSFDIAFAIPSAASLGGHVLRACIRGVCSQAVPFTVSVVPGTPPPVASPSPSTEASALPSSEPSSSGSAPPDGSSPSPAAPSDAVSPVPSTTGAVVVPTVAPTLLPADPSSPGTVTVQFPWLRIAIAGIFALGVLLIAVAAVNEKWLKGSGGKVFDRGSPSDLLQHEATHAGDGEATGDVEDAAPAELEPEPAPDRAQDVKLKGKKIKEN